MNKKNIYIAVFIVVVVLGYINYFGDEGEISNKEQVIETSNVTYTNDDYVVEAEKQKDYIQEKETGFEKAKAKVNGMSLSGDNVLIDKLKNLSLKNNILGISPNGWRFTTQSANYNKLKDEVTSDTGVVATNSEKGIKISGQNFVTDSKMSYIQLTKDVVLENQDIAIKGDKGSYDDLSKVVVLSDNITLEGRGKNEGVVDGDFKTLKYDTESRVLEAWEPYSMVYKGIKLNAGALYFKEDDQSLKVTKNVTMEVNGFKIYVDRIDKAPNSNLLNIKGKIKGSDGVYSFEGDSGVYNTQSKILTIAGNIKGSSTKGEKLYGDKLVYNTDTKLLVLSGADGVRYSSKDGELRSKSFEYYTESKELKTEYAYTFIGDRYESKGKKLYYNSNTKDMKITSGYLLDKVKAQRAQGEVIAYNTQTKDTSIIGKANLEDKKYVISSDNIIYTALDKNVTISGEYKVKSKDNKMTLAGTDANYNQDSGDFISSGAVTVTGDNFIAKGRDLVYNSKTALGKLGSSITVENKKDNLKLSGDRFSFKNGEYMDVDGNLHIISEKMVLDSQRARYNLKDKNIYIPEKIVFKSTDGKTDGTLAKGVYHTETSKFVGDNFLGTSGENKLTSNKMTYFSDEDRALFQKRVVMRNSDTLFEGESVEYYPKEELVKSLEAYKITYKDFIFKGNRGTFNNKTGILDGEKSDITATNGDRFISDRVHGNLKEMILDFTGNVKGHTTDKGVVTNFAGEFARVYFRNSGKYEVLRSEVRDRAEFIQQDKILKSDYIEIDPTRRLVLSKESTELVLNDSKNGEIIVTSDSAEVDIENDIATLIGNVKITNENEEYGLTKVRADRGIIKQKSGILELIEHVEIENNESIVQADRGIYNMNTKKIKASGHVYVDYKKK